MVDSQNQEIKDFKLSVALYIKNMIRQIQSTGYNDIEIPKTLRCIELLFVCIESTKVELK